jgi:hypothetical protein
MNSSERHPRVGPFLTQRGTGEFKGYEWTFHGNIKPDGVYTYLSIDDAQGRTGGMGGGGIGDPGSDVLSDRTRGHIASTGQLDSAQGLAEPGERRAPNAVDGVVTGPVSRVVVELSDGSSAEATMLSSGVENVQFFVLVHPSGLKASSIIAFDSAGHEQDRSS